jgi:hypothetical protein
MIMPDTQDVTQQPSAATAIGQQFLQNGGQSTPTPDQSQQAPQNAQPSAPAPAATAPTPEQQAAQAQTAKHTAIGQLFSKLASGGSGSSASNFWRSIIGGAIVGMGAGAAAPVVGKGPYGEITNHSIAGAAARGAGAGLGFAQQQQDRQRAAQDDMNDQVLKQHADAARQIASIHAAAEHDAQMKILNQRIDEGNFAATTRIADRAQQQVGARNAMLNAGGSRLSAPDGSDIDFASTNDAEKAAHANPTFFIGEGNAQFKHNILYNPESNRYEIWRVPDTDIKNIKVQLADGTTQTIPRMDPGHYLDFAKKQQEQTNIGLQGKKLEAETNKIVEQENLLKTKGSQTKVVGGLAGAALKELDGATGKDGNVDLNKISEGSKVILYDRASKNVQVTGRTLTGLQEKLSKFGPQGATPDPDAAKEIQSQIDELKPIHDKYARQLATLTGNQGKAPAAGNSAASAPKGATNVNPAASAPKIAVGQQVTLKNGQRVTVSKVNADGTFSYN